MFSVDAVIILDYNVVMIEMKVMGIALDTAKEYKKEGKKRLGARLQALGMGMFVYVFL